MYYYQMENQHFTTFSPEDYIVPTDTRGFIYMVHDYTEPAFIKVGRTTDMQKRILNYNGNRPKNPVQIVAITAMFQDCIEVERRIFLALSAYHEKIPTKGTREWYDISCKNYLLELMAAAEEEFDLVV